MKQVQLLLLVFTLSFNLFSQEFKVKIPPSQEEIAIINNGETVLGTESVQSPVITILASNLASDDYILSSDQMENDRIFNKSNTEHLIAFSELNGAEIVVKKNGETVLKSRFRLNVKSDVGELDGKQDGFGANGEYKTPEQLIEEYFPGLIYKKGFGYIIGENNLGTNKTSYVGKDYVHIFLDGFGNSILSAIPQGSPEITYIVHIVTSLRKGESRNIRYSVKQTAGDIDDVLVFRNTGKLDNFIFNSAGEQYEYYHSEYLLRESNKDITFEVYKGVTDGNNTVNTKLNSLTIPIKIYNGSFDIGLLKSELSNPSFSFAPSSLDPNVGNVKKNDAGSRGMVTAMATFYGSPILAFRRIVLRQREQVPSYKLTGRNYISDHTLFERFYPAVGLSINDNTFDNIFYGFNWEIVKGGSLFAGWHYGKINAFDIGDGNFQFGLSEVTMQQFDLSTKQEWKTDFAIGVNLDVLVILNLLQKGASNK